MVSLTERAADRIKEMEAGAAGSVLRIGACCAGLRFVLSFDQDTRAGDTIADSHGVLVVVDEWSAELFGDAVFDYEEQHDTFRVDGPPLTAGQCNCGSFRDDPGVASRVGGWKPGLEEL